jgi:hypothetical protein
VKVNREQNQAGVLGKSPGHYDRPDEQRRRRAESRRGHMLGRQAQTEITHANEKDDHDGGQNLFPVFSQDEKSAPQDREDKAALLAQGAQEEKHSSAEKKREFPRANRGQGANRAEQSEKSESRCQRVRPPRNVGHRGGVERMNRPGESGQKSQEAPFSFVDFPEAEQFVAQQKQSHGRAEVAKNAGEMVAGRLENERPVIEQISQSLDGPVEIGRGRIDEKKMLKRLRGELPAADQGIAQNQGGVVPDKFVPQGGRIDRQGHDGQEEKRQDFFQQRNSVGQKQ